MKAAIRKLVQALSLVAFGAFGALYYLHTTLSSPTPEVENLLKSVQAVVALLVAVSIFVPAPDSKFQDETKTISPALSGVAVVLATGAVAAMAFGWHAHRLTDYGLPGLIVILTLVLAVAAYRFATKFKDQIGEAHFETPEKDPADS